MSSAPRQLKVLSPSRAWACAAVNQLAFPGAGTVMAGRTVGYIQATIMVAGFILTMVYLMALMHGVFNLAMNSTTAEAQSSSLYHHQAWAGKTGMALTILAWCWSLFSSVEIVRTAQKEPPVLC